MLRWDQYGFHKERTGKHYTKLVFLHPVEFVGQVVHSGASTVRNVDAIHFMLGWDWYGFNKRTRYAELVFLHPVASAGRIVHFAQFGA
jgi:hypothetical protein